MTKIIQIRNVPEGLHRTLKARAAQAGMSLSGYLPRELERLAERPTLQEMRARLRNRPPVDPMTPPADIIRTGRGE